MRNCCAVELRNRSHVKNNGAIVQIRIETYVCVFGCGAHGQIVVAAVRMNTLPHKASDYGREGTNQTKNGVVAKYGECLPGGGETRNFF